MSPSEDKSVIRQWILSRLLFVIYRLWSWTWRLRVHAAPNTQSLLDSHQTPLVFAHWHGHEMAILPLLRPFRIATLISHSKDGELMDFVVNKLGGKTSRGSSSRGAIGGLKGLIRLCRQGHNASMAVDGPKGPIYKVKSGVFELSRLLGAPVIPMGVASSSQYVFKKSWNKAMLPLPFSRVEVFFGDFVVPLSKEISPRDPQLAKSLEDQLQSAAETARNLISG